MFNMQLELIHIISSEEFNAELNYEPYYYIHLVSLYVDGAGQNRAVTIGEVDHVTLSSRENAVICKKLIFH